jgi:secreted PhoX family phosphatase
VPPGGPGGYIFKFTPDRPGDMSSGQLYALKIVAPVGDRTGWGVWVPLDRDDVQVDADAAATAAGATGYGRPEDVEIATSTGNAQEGAQVVYASITNEHRVLRIDLAPHGVGRRRGNLVFVSDYAKAGVNAPADFINPDNLALDKQGNLYIAEDSTTPPGNDLWVAVPRARRSRLSALTTVRFATLTDCDAEVSGIYFDRSGRHLFVNVLHVIGTPQPDLAVIIRAARD